MITNDSAHGFVSLFQYSDVSERIHVVFFYTWFSPVIVRVTLNLDDSSVIHCITELNLMAITSWLHVWYEFGPDSLYKRRGKVRFMFDIRSFFLLQNVIASYKPLQTTPIQSRMPLVSAWSEISLVQSTYLQFYDNKVVQCLRLFLTCKK